MIQRIQTVYLAIATILLVTISFYGNLFEIKTSELIYQFKSLGIYAFDHAKTNYESFEYFPFFIAPLFVAFFSIKVIFSYKNLTQQLNYARFLWMVYFALILGILGWYYFYAPKQIDGEIQEAHFSTAFYLLVTGLPLTHLAFINIRKDKRTIDSLNRLR